jgi:two-component system NtrC family sensor kinase
MWLPNKHMISKMGSIKFRVQLFVTILLLVVVGLPLGYLVYTMDKNYREVSTNLVETTTHAVYQSIFDELMNHQPEQIQRVIESYRDKPNIEVLRIFRPNGDILFSTNRAEIGQSLNDINKSTDPGGKAFSEEFDQYEDKLRHYHPLYIQKECTPCHTNLGQMVALIGVDVNMAESQKLFLTIRRMIIISAILIFVILWVGINLFFDKEIQAKIVQLKEAFATLGKGENPPKLQTAGNDEFAQLGAAFNQMVEALNAAKVREAELIRENLAHADRLMTMGEVTAEIAHEVNNPAGIILNRAELMRDELKDYSFSNGFLSDLDTIIRQTRRIAATTQSILHYARKKDETYHRVDLLEVIAASVKIMQPRLDKQNVKIAIHCESSEVPVFGSITQLQQVFCNLISNSLDALPATGGTIDISVNPAEDSSGKQYRIIFADNGSGIPEAHRDRIFSAFFTTKAAGKGTGLGLFITQNILQKMGGKIFLDTTYQNGAAFVIELEIPDEQ